MKKISILTIALLSLPIFCHAAAPSCAALPNNEFLTKTLKSIVKPSSGEVNGGFELNMWATVVAADGTVCSVAKTGKEINDQWLGSRVISAQKANTAAMFSLNSANGANKGLALSTANLWAATQPGASLFGLQFSNPVDPTVAYAGNSAKFGSDKDPMIGKRIGGVNLFGGGFALYNASGKMVGGVGVSGDSSCADHNIGWKLRSKLALDYVPGGVSPTNDDNIIYDTKAGFGHPECGNNEKAISENLPKNYPIRK